MDYSFSGRGEGREMDHTFVAAFGVVERLLNNFTGLLSGPAWRNGRSRMGREG